MLLECAYAKEQLAVVDHAGMNALHHACFGGHVKIFRMLFEEALGKERLIGDEMAGQTDGLGRSCLHLAVGERACIVCWVMFGRVQAVHQRINDSGVFLL